MTETMPRNIGTLWWWVNEEVYGFHGIAHVILQMVATSKISPRKGVELLEELKYRKQAQEVPAAPWEEFTWDAEQ